MEYGTVKFSACLAVNERTLVQNAKFLLADQPAMLPEAQQVEAVRQ